MVKTILKKDKVGQFILPDFKTMYVYYEKARMK